MFEIDRQAVWGGALVHKIVKKTETRIEAEMWAKTKGLVVIAKGRWIDDFDNIYTLKEV
jgi:hypothetical protein